MNEQATTQRAASSGGSEYVVVARRYRPRSFEELVGQNQVSRALGNAINTNRVGHAYLFTGARGVGKTSTARILAKALNCVQGPTPTPCNECDICLSISAGEDVDVLEIDGASNRGIDEIRQLRSNAGVRPSRSRFKIYIIDEVHMLTTPAFNALLKTLEEPPDHVKFIFCTTDPEKIPITVLSRCQRFDFAPVEVDDIVERLRFIVESEQREADADALRLLARRAGGSMRDSQSLLEQLLSFSSERITTDEVHSMLGTARGGRLATLTGHLISRDPAAALQEVDAVAAEGVDLGQLTEQLLGHFRDMMAATVGCPAEVLLHSAPEDHGELLEAGKQLGLQTILAIVEILDETVTRLRQSPHVRTLLEVALVRICKLEELDQLATLVAQLQQTDSAGSSGRPASDAQKKNPLSAPAAKAAEASPARPALSPTAAASNAPSAARRIDAGSVAAANGPNAAPPTPLDAAPANAGTANTAASTTAAGNTAAGQAATRANSAAMTAKAVAEADPDRAPQELLTMSAEELWRRALREVGGMTADLAGHFERVASSGPNRLVVSFRATYTFKKESCERADRRQEIEQALSQVAGRTMRVDFELLPEARRPQRPQQPRRSRVQRLREMEQHPMVREAMELFEGELISMEEPPRRDS